MPEPITIEPVRTAVIVIDMQNDFGTKGGMFDRAGVDIDPIQKVVEPISRVLESTRRAGMKVIYLKMGFRPDLSDAGPADSPNRLKPCAPAVWRRNASSGWKRRPDPST
jgi:nicotinamidase-related amidase